MRHLFAVNLEDNEGHIHGLEVYAMNESKARKFALEDIANLTYRDAKEFKVVDCQLVK